AGIIKTWDANTGEEIQPLGDDHDCTSALISLSHENDYLLVDCRKDNKIRILDLTRGELLDEIDTSSGKITTAVWSPDGNFIALGYADGAIEVLQVFDLSGETLTLPSQGYEIKDLSWSPNSLRIASAESGGAVRIWDLSSQGELSIFQVPGSAENVDWSPDGNQIVISSSLGNTPIIRRVWQSTEAQIRSAYQCCVERKLTPEERTKFELLLE
ncbi:unnamed protein product, partial [marine sediment metagenome]